MPIWDWVNHVNAKGVKAEAIDAYEELIQIDPKLFEPYKCIGCGYEADGNYDKALEVYRRSLAMAPNQPEVMPLTMYRKKGTPPSL